MHTYSGESRLFRLESARERAHKLLPRLSMEARQDTITVVLTMAGLLTVANAGYAFHEGMKAIDASSAADLPGATAEAALAAHRQEAALVSELEWQGAGEAGLLAVAGIVTYALLPARRED